MRHLNLWSTIKTVKQESLSLAGKISAKWCLFLVRSNFQKEHALQEKKTCFKMATFSTTSLLSITPFQRIPQSLSYWVEPSFIAHGKAWNGAIVGFWVYSHFISLRDNLQGRSRNAQSKLSPRGLQQDEEVGPSVNWTHCKVYWDKKSEKKNWGEKGLNIENNGHFKRVVVCVLFVVSQKQASPGAADTCRRLGGGWETTFKTTLTLSVLPRVHNVIRPTARHKSDHSN